MREKPDYEELEQRIRDLERENCKLKEQKSILPQLNNRNLIESIIENSGKPILIKNNKGELLLVNRKWEEVTELTREQALGKTAEELFPAETARQLTENDTYVLQTRSAIEAEEFVDTLSGRRHLIANKFPLISEDGSVVGLCGIITDITQRKKAEDDLSRSELFSQKSQAAARIGSYSLDIEQATWSCSAATAEVFGVDDEYPRTVEGWISLIHPDDMETMSNYLFQEVIGKHRSFDKEYRILRDDTGRERWLHGLGELEFDAQGHPIRMIGTIQDITSRKCAEESLVESEARFKALHNASFGGITVHDKGVILECNKGLSEMTGYSNDELLGMNGLLLVAEDVRKNVTQHMLSGNEVPYETIGVRKNGERYPIHLAARNVPYKGMQVRIAEFRDLTALKKAEKENEVLEKKLQQSQKMEAVGRLAGGVAHDFNNMLSVIIGHAELALLEENLNSELHSCLVEIKKAGQRSAELTRQLLAFARKQDVTPQKIDLNQAVSGMIRMLQRLIGEDIDLIWMPIKKACPVLIDPSQVDQILANLCVNARDAVEGGGTLTIETGTATFDEAYCEERPEFSPGKYVFIGVSDDGCGMDAETVAHIFEPFFTTKEAGQGTGLGLATIYGVVSQNNGFITVYSEPEIGSTFKIYLPYLSDHAQQVNVDPESEKLQQGHGTILLVEDDPALLKMTTRMLCGMGYRVIPAASPEEAIQLAMEHAEELDLLITDVVMPKMNGKDLSAKILSFLPDLKHLFMSGYTANVIAHHGVLDGELHFIHKPFTRQELGEKIHSVLGLAK